MNSLGVENAKLRVEILKVKDELRKERIRTQQYIRMVESLKRIISGQFKTKREKAIQIILAGETNHKAVAAKAGMTPNGVAHIIKSLKTWRDLPENSEES